MHWPTGESRMVRTMDTSTVQPTAMVQLTAQPTVAPMLLTASRIPPPRSSAKSTEVFSDLQNRAGRSYTIHYNGPSDSCVTTSHSSVEPVIHLPLTQYIHRNLPTRIFDPIDLWQDYPHIPLATPLKLYYLTQTAFYIHQVLILNAEARRKDHVQMMTHHVITIFLMATSYFSNFTRVGCLIMVLMDWCDIFLPVRPPLSSSMLLLTRRSSPK